MGICMLQYPYEFLQLVQHIIEARMGAAILALWSGVDCALCHHRIYLRHGFLESMERGITPRRRAAVPVQPSIQFLFHLFPIRAQEQPPRIYRHPACTHHPGLGIVGCVSAHEMGHLYEYPVSLVGLIRHHSPVHHHLDE